MIVTRKQDLKLGESVTIIGTVSKKDTSIFHIKTNTCEIPVKYKELLGYTTGHVVVMGTVGSDGIVLEENVVPLKEGMDLKLFDDFLNISKHFPNII